MAYLSLFYGGSFSFPLGPLNFRHIYIHHLEDNDESSRFPRRFSIFLALDISRREISLSKQEICEKTVIWVWSFQSFISSNKKVKLPWQPIHIPTNPKQAKLTHKINNFGNRQDLSVWLIPLYFTVDPSIFLLGH